MSQAPQVIELLAPPAGASLHDEAIAAAGSAMIPGMLVERTAAGELQEHSVAGQNAQPLFALANMPVGGTIDDAYVPGETAKFGAFSTGQQVYAWVGAGAAAVPLGGPLESAGDGTLRNLTGGAATDANQRESIVGYALEAVDNSGGGSPARIRVRVA